MEYDPPVVESFRRKYGEDPRRLDTRDKRWLTHRAGVLSDFMRETRHALAEEASRQRRKPIELTAIVMSTEEENLYNAMDLAVWVRDGLADMIVPYTTVPNLLSTGDSFVKPEQAEFFLRLTRGTHTKLALNLMPRVQPPEQYRTRAHGLYQAGAEYLFFWDTNARDDFSPSWTALRRLGHREELANWVGRGSPELPRPGSRLRKLGDWDLRYATPG